MADVLDNVTRWAPDVRAMLERYDLRTPDVWTVLAQIWTESRGDPMPSREAPWGILQMYSAAAEDCGTSVKSIDGIGANPMREARKAIDCWGKLQRRYTGKRAPLWDYPLLWWGGSGTLSRSRELRNQGLGFWEAWSKASRETLGPTFPDYLFRYAESYYDAALTYLDWQRASRIG